MITPGQAHDVTAYPALMEEVDDNPEQMLADKGYEATPSAMTSKSAAARP